MDNVFNEEQVTFIGKVIEESFKMYHDVTHEDLCKFVGDMSTATVEKLIETINGIYYENEKNLKFIRNVLFQSGLSNEESYKRYCNEFDRLNKHLLDKREDINEK